MIKFPGWGQRNNEGPPDLDQVMRDLSRKINTLFGKSGNNGSPSAPSGNGNNVSLPILPILVVLLLIWLATGFYLVDSGSKGVVQRFGKMADETTEPGPRWHLPYPLEKVTVVNMEQVRRLEVGYRSSGEGSGSKTKHPKEALMLTEDENIIDLQFAVQYNLKNPTEYLFNNRDTDAAVMSAAETAIREVVGKNKLDDLLQKGLQDTSERMQVILDSYKAGVKIISVSLQSAQPPEEVQEAFEDVNRANQDNQRQINEGQAYANDVIPKARGTASRLLAESAGYKLKIESEARGNASRFDQILTQYNNAPEVTRQRLFLDAQEQILSSVSKVVIDQKAGSMMYLPLDKLIGSAPNAPQQSQSLQSLNPQAAIVPDVAATTDRTRDAFRSRDRESR
ncbi:MAG: FtsH protease activity modulator HflK [Methylotenera sp.]|uniref:FtsH protease activity modulator HflK n=1 Tax=Methylotenera sp. TaxID=2051956 RepID=UPI001858CA15|nr:FtsH protease activity modulator HflK [Methylotenera sp.]NOU24514.1 FtsH protease activity modulator HflK [Methylotenera sp.]